jgi:hypothetical protein
MPISLFQRSGAAPRKTFGKDSVMAGVVGVLVIGVASVGLRLL